MIALFGTDLLSKRPTRNQLAMELWAAAAAVAIAAIGSGYASSYVDGLSGAVDKSILSSVPLIDGSMNLLASVLAIVLIAYAFLPKKSKVYVLDFSVFAAPER